MPINKNLSSNSINQYNKKSDMIIQSLGTPLVTRNNRPNVPDEHNNQMNRSNINPAMLIIENQNNNEEFQGVAEIVKKITSRFALGQFRASDSKNFEEIQKKNEERATIFKNLFRQLIEHKIQKQMTDIENRKRIFMDSFAFNLHRKMTGHANLQTNPHESSSNNPFNMVQKPAVKSQMNITRQNLEAVNSGAGKVKEKPMETDPIADNAAMSVDGDISYSSIEMDETLIQQTSQALLIVPQQLPPSVKPTNTTGPKNCGGVV